MADPVVPSPTPVAPASIANPAPAPASFTAKAVAWAKAHWPIVAAAVATVAILAVAFG